MNIRKDRTGEKSITNQGYEVEIIECFGTNNNTVMFIYNGHIVKNIAYNNFINGKIRNPFHKSVNGIGYEGVGKYKKKVHRVHYEKWKSALERYESTKYPTYKTVTVCKEWECFQNFAEWFDKNWKPWMDSSWSLDKDILIKGNKVYSPETCCFVPQELNKILVNRKNHRGLLPLGVKKQNKRYQARLSIEGEDKYLGTFDTPEEAFKCYKFHKEEYIKIMAGKWKPLINEKVYKALYNWKIEITD